MVLVEEVRELLAAHAAAPAFLRTQASLSPELAQEFARLKPEEAGERIGPYKLLQPIGEGGFGTVWMAEQERPVRRRVALKIIKMGMDTKEVIARFEQERQALALMEHPNIAKVFDAGATPFGRPFFVMELVRGVPITEFCDEAALSTHERLELFIQVCQAVGHAHQKGLIHRDLKPSNVLVATHDGAPLAKVIDFGVAKATQERLTDQTLFTQFEQMIGTPLYMSPEQAGGELDIDTRTDIYALGVMLYELLTGRTPCDPQELLRANYDEMRRLIREQEPPKPSTAFATMAQDIASTVAQRRHTESPRLVNALRGDLDWIVMRALDKDRKRRYDTAAAFALDLQRTIRGEAVSARAPTAAYLLGKLFRRHRVAFSAGAAIALAVLLGLGVSTVLFFREKTARTAADRAEEQATHEAADAKSARGHAETALVQSDEALLQIKHRRALEAIERDQPGDALAWLAAVLRQRPDHPTAGSLILSVLSERSFALPVGTPIRLGPAEQPDLQFLSDGRLLTRTNSAVTLRDFAIGQLLASFPGSHRAMVSPDLRWLLLGSHEEWFPKTDRDASVEVWEISSGKKVTVLQHDNTIVVRSFSPDNTLLATGDRTGRIKLWKVPDWTLARDNLRIDQPPTGLLWSADGKLLAAMEGDPRSYHVVWNVLTGIPVTAAHELYSTIAAFSPRAEVQITGGHRPIQILDFDGHMIAPLRHRIRPAVFPAPIAFAPAGDRFAVLVREQREVRLLDSSSGEEAASPLVLTGRASAQEWSPEGSRLLSMADNGTARLWDSVTGSALGEEFTKRGVGGWSPALAPDGEHIALPTAAGMVERWTLQDGRVMAARLRPVPALFRLLSSPDRRTALAMWSRSDVHRMVDLETGTWRDISAPGQRPWPGNVAFSQDGSNFAIGGPEGDDSRVAVWDSRTLQKLSPWMPASGGFAFLPNSPAWRRRMGKLITADSSSTGKQANKSAD